MNDLSALDPLADVPLPTAAAIGAIALKLAVDYHGATCVSDGTLYQQYKIEGRELTPISVEIVLETARQFERHLLATNERIAAAVVEAIEFAADEQDETNREANNRGEE